MNVLVAYTSIDGSTSAVASRIADRLRAAGHVVTTGPVEAVAPIEAYDAVILGSTGAGRRGLDEAVRLVETHRRSLPDGPLWTYSVDPLDARSGPVRGIDRSGAGRIRDRLGDRQPLAHRVFSGAVSPSRFALITRWFPRLIGARNRDLRDGPAVDRWADTIARELDRGKSVATREVGNAVLGST